MSVSSTTTAFKTGVDGRDTFHGEPGCIVCGVGGHGLLEHCHISMESEPHVWDGLRRRNWIPSAAKARPQHDPRNGILMCGTHHSLFNSYYFFIRYVHASRKYVFVNYSGHRALQHFHGKAVALRVESRYAPFPSLFIVHEMRVRGFHPFQPISVVVPDVIAWQDWMLADNVFNEGGNNLPLQPQSQPTTASTGGAAPTGQQAGGNTLAPLDADVIAEILAATRAMPSWKACQIEGTNWSGTAEENIQTYISTIGVPDEHD